MVSVGAWTTKLYTHCSVYVFSGTAGTTIGDSGSIGMVKYVFGYGAKVRVAERTTPSEPFNLKVRVVLFVASTT